MHTRAVSGGIPPNKLDEAICLWRESVDSSVW
jgi:hypothetical protein